MTSRLSRISFRLPALVVLATAFASLAVGAFSYFKSSEEVRAQETAKLVSLRQSRHATLNNYFQSIQEDLQLLAANEQVADSLLAFQKAFSQIDQSDRANEERQFHAVYTPENTAGDGAVAKAFEAPALISYFYTHNKHHDWFRVAQKLKGYYDIFLITPAGDVVYTVFKERDFATNLLRGKWADTGLAKAFKGAVRGEQTFVNFQPYQPSNEAPASFIAQRIQHRGRTIGVLAFQMPIERINKVLHVTAGMGETGETYIVGSDLLMHSDSRFSKTSTILKTRVETNTVERALKGETGVASIVDYRGVPVLSAFQPFTFGNSTWALIAEIDMAEIEIPIDAMRQSIIFISFGLMLLVAFGGIVVAGTITRPLSEVNLSIQEFRQTHQPVDLSRFAGEDEISEIAQGFQATSKEVADYIASINEAREELKQGEKDIREREERIRSLIDVSPIGFILTRFDGSILMTNQALHDILGWASDAQKVPDIAQIYQNLEDRKRYVEILKRDGAVSRFETVLLRSDGTPVWITLSSKVIEYDDEPAIMAWLDDVTERKKAEQELAEKEAILRLSFDTMADGIYVLDHNLNYLLFNNRYLEMVDLPKGTVNVGGSVEKAIRTHAERGDYGPGETEDLILNRLTALQNPDFVQGDLSIDGGRKTLNLRKVSTKGGGAVIVMTDVTERRLALSALNAERARVDAVMNSVPDAVITIDATGSIETVNQSVQDIFGYHPDELIGRNVKILMPQEFGRVHDANVKAYVETGENKFIGQGPRELPAVTKDGRRIPIELSIGEAKIGDESIFVGVARDISLRKEAEAQLKMAMENMPGAMWVVDPDLKLVMANDRYKDFYGDTNDIIRPGASMADIVRQEAEAGLLGDGKNVEEIVEDRMKSYQSKKETTFEDRTEDGRSIQLLRRPTEDGYIISVATDITEQKKAEEEIRRNQAVLKSVLDQSPMAFSMKDTEQKYVMVNKTHADWFGRDARAMVGSRSSVSNPSDQEDMFQGADRHVLEQREAAPPIEYRDEKPFRLPMDLIAFKFPVIGADGELIGIGTVQSDLTERKKAEREIEDQRAQLDGILSNISQGVVMFDVDRRLMAWNSRYPLALNIEPSFFHEGMELEEITLFQAERGDYGEGEPHGLSRGRADSLYARAGRQDMHYGKGVVFDVQNLVTSEGKLLITYTDITERKKSEQIIANAMKLINESIAYASRIQRSVLPTRGQMEEVFVDHFAIWEPRDVVGGDVYLLRECEEGQLLVVADCTGHGVPGAFMAMIATGSFDQALIENPSGDPAALLSRVNQLVKTTLGQDGDEGESDDGFECGICLMGPSGKTMTFAGARFELWEICDAEFQIVKGDKPGIGYRRTTMDQTYTNHEIDVRKSAMYYMFTDGITDQVGGQKNRAFGKRRLKSNLLDYYPMDLTKQAAHLLREFKDYQHNEERRDDVTFVGFVPKAKK